MPATASWITRRAHLDGAEAYIRNTNINVWDWSTGANAAWTTLASSQAFEG